MSEGKRAESVKDLVSKVRSRGGYLRFYSGHNYAKRVRYGARPTWTAPLDDDRAVDLEASINEQLLTIGRRTGGAKVWVEALDRGASVVFAYYTEWAGPPPSPPTPRAGRPIEERLFRLLDVLERLADQNEVLLARLAQDRT